MFNVKFDRPAYTKQDALRLAQDVYGLIGTVQPLPSERDQNFYFQTDSGKRYVLKIANPAEPVESLDLQNQTLQRLAEGAPHLAIPKVIPAQSGQTIIPIPNETGNPNQLRLFTYVPGQLWAHCNPHTPDMLHSLGIVLGTIDQALEGFAHDAARRELKWDLARADWIKDYVQYIQDPTRRALVEKQLSRFQSEIKPKLAGLRTGVIYNDANDYNVLVSPGDPRERRVIGVIDFGDLVHSQVIGELAIACAYAILDLPDPLTAAAQIVKGYNEVFPLTEAELEVLFPLICMRSCVTVTNAAFQAAVESGDDYLVISERPAGDLLEKLSKIPVAFAHYTFRAAAGLAPCAESAAVADWLKLKRETFSPIVKSDLSNALAFDLSLGSLELGTNADFENPITLADRLNNQLLLQNATVGIGRYNEVRPFYNNADHQIQSNTGPDWQTVHLGLDFFVPVGSPVYAPLDGTVYQVEVDSPIPTLILKHTPENGPAFFTLYRHLMADSLAGWEIGGAVPQETCIGAVESTGTALPAHLHFQIVAELMGLDANFPGLARASELAVWQSVCPDPSNLANLPRQASGGDELGAAEIMARRRQSLGRNLSLAYGQPLHIVRGYKQYLYDADGRQYLDAVNNVAHVGHSHPRVVRAIQAQQAVLNTNTRYLHANIVAYAERLCATLPEPLNVVYFVCSGSEANELALRLARTYTRSKETIVLDRAYHGNSNALIEVSPYKYERAGGSGPQPYIHKVSSPDTYRGPHKADDPLAGQKYAAEVAEVIAKIQGDGRKLSAFIAESLMGSAGQIPLAPNYLREAYRHVREAGGLCIADEVQTGLGRVGSQFWGFQLQGAVPDIVTVGKPIGNGHPLGAVITTPEIAAAFDNGMEYFNTFGGNPVACAAGLAVLEVLEAEGLQAHALEVGDYFMGPLRQLQAVCPLIGDVRGSGLFIGVELVKNRETLERALDEADYVVNRMKEQGILLSADFDTLKIKPPLPFNQADVDFFVETLDKVLQEDFLKQQA